MPRIRPRYRPEDGQVEGGSAQNDGHVRRRSDSSQGAALAQIGRDPGQTGAVRVLPRPRGRWEQRVHDLRRSQGGRVAHRLCKDEQTARWRHRQPSGLLDAGQPRGGTPVRIRSAHRRKCPRSPPNFANLLTNLFLSRRLSTACVRRPLRTNNNSSNK